MSPDSSASLSLVDRARALLAERFSNERSPQFFRVGLSAQEQIFERGKPRPFIEVTLALLATMGARTIVEIGSMRSPMRHAPEQFDPTCCNDGHSTFYWGMSGCEVHSVDIDPACSAVAAEACKAFPNVHVHNGDGIAFLANFRGRIDLLYLDAWDVIENTPYAEKHLEAYHAARPALAATCIILIDDTDILFGGKGRLAIPAMIRDGFTQVVSGRQTLLIREGGGGANAEPGRRVPEVDKVVSTCISRDLKVWKVTAPRVLRHIDASRYEVIVPDSEVGLFRENTPLPYEIVPESRYNNGFDLARIRTWMPEHRKDRAGWYLQQLLKLEGLRTAERDEDVVLIWDADTVPVTDLKFVTPEGRLIYRTGEENHTPYFVANEKLFGLPKLLNRSFIAQCIPARRHWVQRMVDTIEARHGVHYFEAILNCAEKDSISGFGEPEALGTFAFHHFGDQMVFSGAPWLRSGEALFGTLETFVAVMDLEYVCFEHD